jgi:threonine/homoserine/homoserine lactone efflux protein
VLGLLSGHLAATLVVAGGVGALVAAAPGVLMVLTVVGATYLVWLGVGMLCSAPSMEAEASEKSETRLRQVVRGFGVSGLNPKVFLLFLALLPQFVDHTSSWPPWIQMVVLGLVHIAGCGAVYLGVGYGARRVLGARPSAARTVTRVSGVAMIAIGILLVVEQVVGA